MDSHISEVSSRGPNVKAEIKIEGVIGEIKRGSSCGSGLNYFDNNNTQSQIRNELTLSNARGVVDHRRGYSEQIPNSLEKYNGKITYNRVITALNNIEKQEVINNENSKLHAVNLMMNLSNKKKIDTLDVNYKNFSSKLQNQELILSNLNETLNDQNKRIGEIDSDVATVKKDVDEQKMKYSELNSKVEIQSEHVNKAMDSYEKKLDEQKEAIEHQNTVLNKLLSVRFRIDFAVDCGIILFSYWLSKRGLSVALVNMIVKLVLTGKLLGAVPKSKRKFHLVSSNALSLLIVYFLVKKFRGLAMEKGVHNLVGNYEDYLYLIQNGAVNTLQYIYSKYV